MAEYVIFVKFENGRIHPVVGDYCLQNFVQLNLKKYESVPEVGVVYRKFGLLEPDPIVRDRLMAREFSIPGCVHNFIRLARKSDQVLAIGIKNLIDRLSYSLFPMAPELDKLYEDRFDLKFGSALMRSVDMLPNDTDFTYCLRECVYNRMLLGRTAKRG